MFQEVDLYTPPDTVINRKYQAVFEMYNAMNSRRSKAVARKMAAAFIRRHGIEIRVRGIIDAAAAPAAAAL